MKSNLSTKNKLFAYRCRKIWTMDEESPLDNGVVVIKNGFIIDVGKFSHLKRVYPSHLIEDKGNISLTPGLINIHTHLELSHLHKKTKLGEGFVNWLKSLIPWLLIPITKEKIRESVESLVLSGTVAVGDISSRAARKVYEVLKEKGMYYCLFIEFLGKRKEIKFPKGINPKEDGYISLTAHSPYSASPELIIKCKKWTTMNKRPFAIHLAESQEEVDFLVNGKGELSTVLMPLLGRGFKVPGMHPVEYLNSLNVLDHKTLAIHCVKINKSHINLLKEKGCFVCICPRSNHFIGVGKAPWEKMYSSGIPICIATDGLCSNKDLNLWNEVEFLINNSKIELNLYELLKMVTINPAKISRLDSFLGTISVGKIALFSFIPSKIEELFKP